MPFTAASTMNAGMDTDPVSTSTASRAWLSADTVDDPTSTYCRGNRSATTPPHSRNTTFAIERVATTTPRVVTDDVTSRTANTSAICAIALPALVVTRAVSSQRKAGCAKGANESPMRNERTAAGAARPEDRAAPASSHPWVR